jgi:gliding motility-associated-like protein
VPGTYQVTVYDTSTTVPNCLGTVNVVVPDVLLPIFTHTKIDITCNGSNDGSITVYATDNGLVPLSYTISPAAGTFNAVTNTFENLPPGTYSITATGTNNCTSTINNITIVEPAAIVVPAATVVEFGCTTGNNPNNATITIDGSSITGGSGTYVIYEFINDQGTAATGDDVIVQSGANQVYIETNPAGGSYTINVYDNNGCLGSTNALIQPYDELLGASSAVTNPLSCSPGTDGEITLTVTSTLGDSTRFEYSIDNGATYQVSNVFSGLDAGTYNFLIRHIDTGCVITATETIIAPELFTIDVVKLQDVICFGTETGEVTLELIDATYAGSMNWIIWNTNGTLADTSDDVLEKNGTFATPGPTGVITLNAGSYVVEITQNGFPMCTNTTAFTISGPAMALTSSTVAEQITCLGNDGVIEFVNSQGGWGGYNYYVGLTPPTGPGDYVSNPRFENLSVGTYQTWIIDSEGCSEQILPDVTLVDPTPITATLQVNQENCNNFEGEIEVVGVSGGQGSNYTYQLILNGSTIGSPQNSPVFSNLGAGTYEVLIADQWSCTFTTNVELLYEELSLVSTVVKPIDCTTSPGGEITIVATGGSGNLEYVVTFPDTTTTITNSTGVFTGLTQVGTYVFVVNDLDTTLPTCSQTINQELTAPSVTEISLTDTENSISHVSCYGLSDGSITVVLSPTSSGINEDPVYMYNLYDATGATLLAGPQTSPIFDGLAAGFYQVEAVSSKSCTDIETVEVTQPTELLIDAVATTFVCNSDNTVNTSTITVSILDGATTPGVPSGTGPYLYSLDNVNFQSANTFEILDNGTTQNLTVYVQDANGCATTDTVTIEPINSFTATVAQNTAISCANPEEVLITVSDNGNPSNSYTYELLPLGNTDGVFISSPTNVTAIFELLLPGTYTFRVTDITTGCYVDTAAYEIAPYDLIDVVATATSPVICFGDNNGTAEIEITGYAGAYTYEVFTQAGVSTGITGAGNTSTNPMTITGLSGGNYFVRVVETNNPLCSEDSNVFTIVSPDMALDAAVSEVAPVTCTNDQGEVLIEPVGGYTPYDIVLNNSTTGQTYSANDVGSTLFSGLSAGVFTVQITDANGCIFNSNITLVEPVPITADITASVTALSCFGDTNAMVSAINVMNGEGTYSYQLNVYDATGTTIVFSGGAQTSPDFDNLGAGTYSITVSDTWSCDVETPQVTITEPTEVESNLVQSGMATCTQDAQLTLTASGGTAPYEFSVDNVVYMAMSGGNTHVFSNVTPGTYQFYVRDSFGCEATISNQISIEPIEPLQISIDDSAAMINCTGDATATLIATATGGLGSYSYELFADSALTNLLAGPQSSGEFNNLTMGSYFVRVTSQDCVEVSSEVIITEPVPLQIDTEEFTNVTCAGENDGTITVEVSGGTGQILYAITPFLNQFDTKNAFTDLEPGIYDVIAQDENGCFLTFQFEIVEPEPLAMDFTSMPVVCFGEDNGSINVTIQGGTAPYSTAFNSNQDADFVLGQTTFNDLAAGTYVIFVRDAQGCETNIIAEVGPGVNLNASVEPMYSCDGILPVSSLLVEFEDESVRSEVMYALDSTDPADLQLDYEFGDIPAGTHTLTISHSNGCSTSVDFEVMSFEPLTIQLEQSNINEITAHVEGGLEEYTYFFNGEDNGTDNVYHIRETGDYEVAVIDANGCTASATIFMEYVDVEFPNFFTPNTDGSNDTWKPKNIEIYPKIITIIYDRYGRVVYKMGLDDAGWDGTYDGKDLPTGDYWYVVKLKGDEDDREFVGHFTLYR